jgi:hypothetical protein
MQFAAAYLVLKADLHPEILDYACTQHMQACACFNLAACAKL